MLGSVAVATGPAMHPEEGMTFDKWMQQSSVASVAKPFEVKYPEIYKELTADVKSGAIHQQELYIFWEKYNKQPLDVKTFENAYRNTTNKSGVLMNFSAS